MAIKFGKTPIPWKEPGSMPSSELQTNGFQAGYKPAAQTFNAILNNTSECLTELQNQTSNLDDIKAKKDLTNVDNTVFSNKAASAGGTGFKVGKSLAGQTVSVSSDGTTVTTGTAGNGAEIFNDYSVRTFDETGAVTSGNVAKGDFSHAEGRETTASGSQSHAEGRNTTASGAQSHAEGYGTTASGHESHAEGINTTASGGNSHAEGLGTTASGTNSHAEGENTTAKGAGSHAEGANTEAIWSCSHAEGRLTKADGDAAHAEGRETTASGSHSHAEGQSTTASGAQSHAEGMLTKAEGENAHAEGQSTTASGAQSHAEGRNTTASVGQSHAEGYGTTASGDQSHAQGYNTTASGGNSHAQGHTTTASGTNSHAEGANTAASGAASHAQGAGTTASGDYSHCQGLNTQATGVCSSAGGQGTIAESMQTVYGKFNKSSAGPIGPSNIGDQSGDIFIIGNGTGETTRSNAFRVTTAGKAYGLSNFSGSGADYAEMWEIEGGNPEGEDWRGFFVTVNANNKISKANAIDYILGAISSTPCVIGDVQSELWHDMYLKDVFGEKLIETVEVEETTDEDGRVIPAHTEKRWILNPEYDPARKYISRDERPEWATVGLMGKLIVIDDGTCVPGQFCKVADGGIATASGNNEGYRVLERKDENHIRIMFR